MQLCRLWVMNGLHASSTSLRQDATEKPVIGEREDSGS
jgi:hypothetical protein